MESYAIIPHQIDVTGDAVGETLRDAVARVGLRNEMTFDVAIAAARFSLKGMEMDCLPLIITAGDHKAANDKAIDTALQRWPKKEFWTAHTSAAVLR